MKNVAFILTLFALVLEGVMAIPVFGGTIVMGFVYIPLGIAFLIHTANLIVRIKSGLSYSTPIVGMVTSMLAIIPFLGWILHVVTTVLLVIDMVRINFKEEKVVEGE